MVLTQGWLFAEKLSFLLFGDTLLLVREDSVSIVDDRRQQH